MGNVDLDREIGRRVDAEVDRLISLDQGDASDVVTGIGLNALEQVRPLFRGRTDGKIFPLRLFGGNLNQSRESPVRRFVRL